MALAHLGAFGWEAEVLAVDPAHVEGMPVESALELTIPNTTRVTRVAALPASVTRQVGLGNLAMRSLPYLRRAGDQLLRRGFDTLARDAEGADNGGNHGGARATDASPRRSYDLVFFSTTQFPVLALGPRWKRKFGVPYVVDIQDPWLDDYYERTGTQPPGGKLRYALSRLVASFLEPRVMRDVSEVIAVSPAYVGTLRRRYGHLRPDQFTVLPFGAPDRDFELLSSHKIKHSVFNRVNDVHNWVYIGRGGDDMAPALRLLFTSLDSLAAEDTELRRTARLHFAGTSYAPAGCGSPTVKPIAEACGVADMVNEISDRQPYFETLQALTEADALLIIGSDSPSYSASKLYPYILARRPMLSILHEQSPAVKILRNCNAGEVVTFDPANLSKSEDAMRSGLTWLKECGATSKDRGAPEQPQVNWGAFKQYSAREMTRKMCEVFDRAVASV